MRWRLARCSRHSAASGRSSPVTNGIGTCHVGERSCPRPNMSSAARAETRAGALVWASAPRRRVARVCQNTGRSVRLGRRLSQRGFLLPEAEASARASTFTAVRAGRATDSTTSQPLACIVGAAGLLLWRARAKDVARGERKDHGADAADPWKEVEADSLVSGLARELSNVSTAPQLAPPARDAPRPARRMFGAALAAATVAAAAAPAAGEGTRQAWGLRTARWDSRRGTGSRGSTTGSKSASAARARASSSSTLASPSRRRPVRRPGARFAPWRSVRYPRGETAFETC